MKFRIETIRDLGSLIKYLAIGLRDISFPDNFQSFEEEVTISAGAEATIRNQIRDGKPRYMIVVSQKGNGLITKSSTQDWKRDFLYVINNGAAEVTATILFIK